MRTLLHTIIITCCTITATFSQTTIAGKVEDPQKEPLIGATVQILGTVVGTITDAEGNFEISTNKELPITIKVSYLGFEAQTMEVTTNESFTVTLESNAERLKEVTVTAASRVDESILEAPVTIEKLSLSLLFRIM